MRATVSRWGNSLALRLPKVVTDDADFQEGAEVDMQIEEGQLVIRRAKPRYALADLLAGYKPEHRHEETDWGAPVGREEW